MRDPGFKSWLSPHPFGLPWWLDGKESACNAGDLGLIPGLGRSPEEGHGNPLQYSCLENPSWREEPARLQSMGHKELDMTERLSTREKHQSDLSNYWDLDMDARGRPQIAETTSVGPNTKRMLCRLGEHAQSRPTLCDSRLPGSCL